MGCTENTNVQVLTTTCLLDFLTDLISFVFQELYND